MAIVHFSLSSLKGLVLLYTFTILTKLTSAQQPESCNNVSKSYSSLNGMSRRDVPITPLPGNHLKICAVGKTCCTGDMEKKLKKHSNHEFDKLLDNQISPLRQMFNAQTHKFNGFFKTKLENAKSNLHTMFSGTYGVRYKQNSHVFFQLFTDLFNYYNGQDINLLDSLDKFFSTLLQKMFELLNEDYEFNPTYLNCVSEIMDNLKPFGDAPNKLSHQVKRAFIAARTFTQGLAVGRGVIDDVTKFGKEGSCLSALMKMRYCPMCQGQGHKILKPCHNYCMNVMKGCLALQADLATHWEKYLDSLLKVGDRLQGPFNFESVVQPIGLKISEAIMAFQENSVAMTQKIFKGCGTPARKGRKKRDATKRQTFDGGLPIIPTAPKNRPINLEQMVKEIRHKLKKQKAFWEELPHMICQKKNMAEDKKEINKCWNGRAQARYLPEVMKDGRLAQNNNPEVDIDLKKPTTNFDTQILQLKLITNKLELAYNGLDVDSIDVADGDVGSGSGSGSGWMDPGSGSNQNPDISFPTPSGPVRTRRPPKNRTPQPPHRDRSTPPLWGPDPTYVVPKPTASAPCTMVGNAFLVLLATLTVRVVL